MSEKVILKLSELPDDMEVSAEGSHTMYTVRELKREILELREPHHETKNWFVAEPRTWCPDAETMFEQYRDNCADDMYENFDEHVDDQINHDTIAKLQAVLDEAFGDGIHYWEYGKDVEIDIFPPENIEPTNTELSKEGK